MTGHQWRSRRGVDDGVSRFLTDLFAPEDWVAILLKAYDTKHVMQRVDAVATFLEPCWQTWLRLVNVRRFNVYVSVNAIRPGMRRRIRAAVATVRHVFLDLDKNAEDVVARLAAGGLPPVSYLIHSSPGRAQVLWRVTGFTTESVERLQKTLAREVGADPAATSAAQTVRVPGYLNHKYDPPSPVSIEYPDPDGIWTPSDFPVPEALACVARTRPRLIPARGAQSSRIDRARCYLSRIPPAIAGQRGDVHTFRVCCRLVRGFALDDEAALYALVDWNARCEPPWTERELIDKLRHAREYGREPVGGLIGAGQ